MARATVGPDVLVVVISVGLAVSGPSRTTMWFSPQKTRV